MPAAPLALLAGTNISPVRSELVRDWLAVKSVPLASWTLPLVGSGRAVIARVKASPSISVGAAIPSGVVAAFPMMVIDLLAWATGASLTGVIVTAMVAVAVAWPSLTW